MGHVYAEIELTNGEDLSLARRHVIGEEEIKRMTVNALVDTGAVMMCINETIQEQMQFPVIGVRKAQMANGHVIEVPLVNPDHPYFAQLKVKSYQRA